MTQPAPDDTTLSDGIAPDALIRELAEALCDVIRGADLSYLEKEPEDAYVDLANRLVLLLAKRRITIVSTFQYLFGQGALRIFKNFTECLKKHPKLALNIRKEERFGIVAVGPKGDIQAFCRGEDAYDACAQLAQVMAYNGGSL